jgi:hypothetical protein
MPRTLRAEYPGAIYHAMDRGDPREDAFVNEFDRRDFLKTSPFPTSFGEHEINIH